MAISDKLQYLNETKQLIKNAINEDFNVISDETFREYASAISTINTAYNPFNDKIGYSTKVCENCSNNDLKLAYKEGYLKQETTTGKNLFDVNYIQERTHNGVTLTTTNNVIHISGTSASNSNFYMKSGQSFILPKGTYTYHIENFSTGMVFSFKSGSKTIVYGGQVLKTFTLEEDTTIDAFTLQVSNTAGAVDKDLFIQIEKGSTATSYEKYTGGNASPNPDYPQEISVYDGVENLFNDNIENIVKDNYLDNLGREIPSGDCWFSSQYIEVKPNTNYTLSSNDSVYRICYYDSNKTFISRIAEEKNLKTFTTPSNCKYLRISGNNSNLNMFNTYQLTKSNTQHHYVPYKNDNYYNLFDGEKEIGSVLADGSNYANPDCWRSVNHIEVEPNTIYTLNFENVSFSTTSGRLLFYDENKVTTTITTNNIAINNPNFKFTTSSNCKYIRFFMGTSYISMNTLTSLQKGTTPIPYHTNYAVVKNSGKNLFDGNYGSGYFAYTGTLTSPDSNWQYCYANAKPNTKYRIGGVSLNQTAIGVIELDINKKFIKYNEYKNQVITTQSNTYYLGISARISDKETFMICEGEEISSYEPYRETTYTRIPLNNNFLSKIGDVKDEIDLVSGELRKRIGNVVLNGSENWNKSSTYVSAYWLSSDNYSRKKQTYYITNYFTSTTNLANYKKGTCFTGDGAFDLWLGDSSEYKTLDQFKTWLSTHNTSVYYLLANEQTINLGNSNISMVSGTNILELENDLDNVVGLTYRKNN